MFLFNKDLDEDILYMKEGYENCLLSEQRLEEAVKRILAGKGGARTAQKAEGRNAGSGKEALSDHKKQRA